jgi:hypothetical protein
LCSPEVHPWIAEDEKRWIIASIGGAKYKSVGETPWLAIFTSIHFWAILVGKRFFLYSIVSFLFIS